jgi:ABC-type transport system involved in cytochrome c biogenesis permease component
LIDDRQGTCLLRLVVFRLLVLVILPFWHAILRIETALWNQMFLTLRIVYHMALSFYFRSVLRWRGAACAPERSGLCYPGMVMPLVPPVLRAGICALDHLTPLDLFFFEIDSTESDLHRPQ